jgi:hypothetical protein
VNLRLVDPNGHTVPDSLRENVTAQDEEKVSQELLTVAAAKHAEEWADFGYRVRYYRIVADRPHTKPVPPTADFHVAVSRFIALLESRPGQRVPASKGRRLAWEAVYGDLWTPDRVGEVPPEGRPALRAVVSRINRQAFPGGARAASVTAAHVRSLWPDSSAYMTRQGEPDDPSDHYDQ